eukprot:UN19294
MDKLKKKKSDSKSKDEVSNDIDLIKSRIKSAELKKSKLESRPEKEYRIKFLHWKKTLKIVTRK